MKNATLILIFILMLIAAGVFIISRYSGQERLSSGGINPKKDLIFLKTPIINETIENPVLIEGSARGFWFFEAEFPIKIFDESGNLLGLALARSKGDWMTENFVEFEAILEFKEPLTAKGTIVLEKNNPSGLAEYDDNLILPVKFKIKK